MHTVLLIIHRQFYIPCKLFRKAAFFHVKTAVRHLNSNESVKSLDYLFYWNFIQLLFKKKKRSTIIESGMITSVRCSVSQIGPRCKQMASFSRPITLSRAPVSSIPTVLVSWDVEWHPQLALGKFDQNIDVIELIQMLFIESVHRYSWIIWIDVFQSIQFSSSYDNFQSKIQCNCIRFSNSFKWITFKIKRLI